MTPAESIPLQGPGGRGVSGGVGQAGRPGGVDSRPAAVPCSDRTAPQRPDPHAAPDQSPSSRSSPFIYVAESGGLGRPAGRGAVPTRCCCRRRCRCSGGPVCVWADQTERLAWERCRLRAQGGVGHCSGLIAVPSPQKVASRPQLWNAVAVGGHYSGYSEPCMVRRQTQQLMSS